MFAIQGYGSFLSLHVYQVPIVVNALIVFILLNLVRMLAGGIMIIVLRKRTLSPRKARSFAKDYIAINHRSKIQSQTVQYQILAVHLHHATS